MIHITQHAIKRYAERIKGVNKKEVEFAIAQNEERYQSDLNKMYEHSRLLGNHKFEKYKEAAYRVASNDSNSIMLILDKSEETLITLYRISHGLGEKIDKKLNEILLDEFFNEKEKCKEIDKKLKYEKDELIYSRDLLGSEISRYESIIRDKKKELKALNEYIGTKGAEEKESKEKYYRIFDKLVFFNPNYKEAQAELS